MLRMIAKNTASVVALFYVVGFVVVNIHLTRYAQASVDLLQARFLAAGLLFALVAGIPLAEAALLFLYVQRGASQELGISGDSKKKRSLIIGRYTFFFIVIQAGAAFSWSLTFLPVFVIDRHRWAEAWNFAALTLVGVSLVLWAESGLEQYRTKSNIVDWLHQLPYLVFMALIGILGSIGSFARGIYPNVPPQFGGGASPLARLILSDTARAGLLGVRADRIVGIVDHQTPFLQVVVCDSTTQKTPRSLAIALDQVSAIAYVQDSLPRGPMAPGNSVIALDADMCENMWRFSVRPQAPPIAAPAKAADGTMPTPPHAAANISPKKGR